MGSQRVRHNWVSFTNNGDCSWQIKETGRLDVEKDEEGAIIKEREKENGQNWLLHFCHGFKMDGGLSHWDRMGLQVEWVACRTWVFGVCKSPIEKYPSEWTECRILKLFRELWAEDIYLGLSLYWKLKLRFEWSHLREKCVKRRLRKECGEHRYFRERGAVGASDVMCEWSKDQEEGAVALRWKRKLKEGGHARNACATERPGKARHVASDWQSLVSGELFKAEEWVVLRKLDC